MGDGRPAMDLADLAVLPFPARPTASAPRVPFRRPRAALALYGVGAAAVVGAAAGLSIPAGAGALAAMALGLLVLSRPAIGAFVLVAVVPITSGLARGLPIPGLRLSELLIGALSALILVSADRARTVPWRAFDWVALAYVAANAGLGALNLLSRGDPFTAENLGTLLGPLQFLLLYRAVVTALPSDEERRRALELVLIASLPVSAMAILQQLNVPGVRELTTSLTGADLSEDWAYQQLPRATGPFPHWHMAGGYLLIVILLCVGLLLEGSRRVLSRRAIIGVLALAVAALAGTVAIAPMFAGGAGALLLGFELGRLGRIAVWLAAAAVAVGLLFGPVMNARYEQQLGDGPALAVPQTVAYRHQVWTEQFIPALSGHWTTGYGPDLPPQIQWDHTESVYITLLLRGGVSLLALYGGLMWALAHTAGRCVAARPDHVRAVARVLRITVVLLAFLHLVMPYFVTTGLPHLLWLLPALVFRHRDEPRCGRPTRLAGSDGPPSPDA